MKFNILIIACIGLIFTFCKNPNSNPDPSMDSSPMMTGFPASSDNTEIATRELDQEAAISAYHGVYQGTLPSASGEGITTILSLFENNRYVLQTVYVGQNDNIFEEYGNYTIVGDLITLHPNTNGDPEYFRIQDNYIFKLGQNQQEITGDQADNYRLDKK